MCNFCENNYPLFEKEFLNDFVFALGIETYEKNDANYDNYIVFIDRGFLRFVLKDDCGCMDHGEKIKK